MEYYVGLDLSLKQTAICVMDRDRGVVWLGSADTHPELIRHALDRWVGSIALARISQTHLGGVSSGADEPGCGSICVALRQSGPGLIV